MNKEKELLLILTRNPILGKTKTRLAKGIGDELALKTYHYLLKHTAQITSKISATKKVFYSETTLSNDVFEDSIFIKEVQIAGDLGEKMYDAFLNGFKEGFEKIIIIGSDLIDLEVNHLEEAFLKLNKHNAVIGPAKDGGFYLLGLTKLSKEFFINKKWSTSSVLKNLIVDLNHEKQTYTLLEELNDIDTIDDLKSSKKLVAYLDLK